MSESSHDDLRAACLFELLSQLGAPAVEHMHEYRTDRGCVEGGGLVQRGRGGPLTGAGRAVSRAGAEAKQPP